MGIAVWDETYCQLLNTGNFMNFEYTVIPAPTRTKRQKGVKTAVERLAFALEELINEMAADGWEYLRTETLTVEDKAGRFSKIIEKIETVLIFRRPKNAHISKTVAIKPSTNHAAPTAPAAPTAQGEKFMDKITAKSAPKFSTEDDATAPPLGGASRD